MRTINTAETRILITGATGFVGSALCRRLLDTDCAIRTLVRSREQIAALPDSLQADAVLGDLQDSESLRAACAGIDTLVHLAAIAHVSASPDRDAANNRANCEGSEKLLQAALEQGVRRIVFISSSLAQAAELDTGDVTAYGKGKRATEKLLLAAAERGQIEVLILRPVNVYGVGMKGNIASMISMIRRGRLPRLPRLGSRISLVGVDDLAGAIELALRAQTSGKIYTVTDGQIYGVNEIEAAIYEALGRRMPRLRTPAVVLYAASLLAAAVARMRGRESGISGRTYRNLTTDNLFTNDELRADLGFQPTQTLYQVLPEIVRDIAANDARR